MLRKLIKQMLTAQIFSALTVSLCLLIDSVMISRFLGETAMAAYSLSNPILLAIGALGTLLAAGIQVACSKSLGKGSQEETNRGYSSALALSVIVSLLFTAAVLLFRSPLAVFMGAGGEGPLFEQTRDYLAGFSIGAPASLIALVLVPFLQMAGKSGLLIAAVLSMTVADVALDLLNALVFHAGMFGMGLASALSYYVAVLISGVYFLSSKCVFRFSARKVSGRKIRELFVSGIPAGFSMAASVIMVYVLNRILKAYGGESAVAAYTVVMSIGNAANCISTGIGGVSLTMSGVLFQEEDRHGLREMLRTLLRAGILLGLCVGILLLVFAPVLVSLFVPEAGTVRDTAILGLRLFAAGLIPCCLNNALKSLYQGTNRVRLTVAVSLAEGAFFPALAALLFARLLGTDGAWLYFAAGELLALLAAGLVIRILSGKLPWKEDAALLLKPDFGVTEENLLERPLESMEDLTAFVGEAEDFCLKHEIGAKTANHIALGIEEMAGNIIQHGFTADRKPHHLSVRLLKKPDEWILRFRDDCRAFDPVAYIPPDRENALGIRLALAMADEARYTYSMSLNNLTLKEHTGKTAGAEPSGTD